ncbi:hypothetical protein Tco_0189752 [Tanacetum coccineum]
MSQNQGKGENKLAYAPKPKIFPPPKRENPTKDTIYRQCGDTGIFTIELYTFPNKSWVYDTGCGTHISNTTQGLRGSRKLKLGALSLYVGNGQRAAVEALVKRDTLTKPDKLEPGSIKCIFVGYPKETMGYSFYYPLENKVSVARNAKFLDNSLITQEVSGSLEDLKIIQEEDTYPSINTSSYHKEDDLEIDEPQSDIIPICRSTRTRHALDRMCLFSSNQCLYVDAKEYELGDLGEPTNYKAALLDPKSDKWLNAMNVEMQSMKENEV